MLEEQTKINADRTPPSGKKPYRAPRLTVYGNLATITKAKGGSGADSGGAPPTRK